MDNTYSLDMKKLKRGDFVVVTKCHGRKKAGCIVYLRESCSDLRERNRLDNEVGTITIKEIKGRSGGGKFCRKGNLCVLVPENSVRYLTDKKKILALKWILLGKKHKQEENYV